MNRTELIQRVCDHYAHDCGPPLDPWVAQFVVQSVFEQILRAFIRGEDVTIRDFGRFEVRQWSKRRRYDVNRGEVADTAGGVSIKFTAARSDPMEKIRSDPFAVPESFETADELVYWLARLAESITSWYALVKGLRAWSATEQVRRDMLTYDQHRAAHAAFQKANDGFRERAFQ